MQAAPKVRQELHLLDSIAIVVGTVIGSAVFIIAGTIGKQLHSAVTANA